MRYEVAKGQTPKPLRVDKRPGEYVDGASCLARDTSRHTRAARSPRDAGCVHPGCLSKTVAFLLSPGLWVSGLAKSPCDTVPPAFPQKQTPGNGCGHALLNNNPGVASWQQQMCHQHVILPVSSEPVDGSRLPVA